MNPAFHLFEILLTKKGEPLNENFVDLPTYLPLWTRFSGTIIGTDDPDPKRWPGSKWRCLKVLTYGA
jgi:hypothetical protein